MKIAILTLPLNTNYGGILQAYALQVVLERMGHDVCLIEKRRKPLHLPLWKAPFAYGKRVLKNLIGRPFPIFYEQKVNREIPIMWQNTDKFIDKYIKRRIVEDFSEIKEIDFDAIVVGSDQIWRSDFIQTIEQSYLDFTEGWNIKRIAYAASFGTKEWRYTEHQTENCSRLIKNFDAVSVRERSGVSLCRDHLGVQAVHVLDPTMLLGTDDYIRLFMEAGTPDSKGNLLCYILDEMPGKIELIGKIAEEQGLTPFRANAKEEKNINIPLDERIQPPVENWLRGFYDAKYVVTDSFHACVFSILFNKPFTVIGNAARGMSRFDSLLEMFGLKNRLITDKFISGEYTNIDWKNVNLILDDMRKKSNYFLSSILN